MIAERWVEPVTEPMVAHLLVQPNAQTDLTTLAARGTSRRRDELATSVVGALNRPRMAVRHRRHARIAANPRSVTVISTQRVANAAPLGLGGRVVPRRRGFWWQR